MSARFLSHEEACAEVFECLKGGDSAVWMGPRSLLEDAHDHISAAFRTHRIEHLWEPNRLTLQRHREMLICPPTILFLPNVATGASTQHVPLLVVENALEWNPQTLMEALLIPAPSIGTGRRPEVLFVGHTEEKTREFLGPLGVLLR